MSAPTPPRAAETTPAPVRGTDADGLARQVIDLARDEVVAGHPFLAPALGILELRLSRLDRKFATDGRTLWADPGLVLADFARTGQAPTHDLVHVTLHCLLLHPFVGEGAGVDPSAWALASDVVVERLAQELLGPREGERGEAVSLVVGQLRDGLSGEPTAERVYRALREGRFANARRTWGRLLAVDDPRRWFPNPSERGDERGEGTPDRTGRRQRAPRQGGQGPGEGDAGASRRPPDEGQPPEGQGRPGSGGYRDGLAGEAPTAASAGGPGDGDQPPGRPLRAREREDARERWRRVARGVRVDLETFSRGRGERMGGLLRELEVGGRRRPDLREFLRKFATPHERVRVSPDEFDYVFYTLGLELFGDMPLIEPLEYREERSVRDFVIVIDTSGSVEGPVVQRFVDTAFDVLVTQATPGARVNVHVIQADAGVQEDVRITSAEDLCRWRAGFQLKGLGGTDFRPALAHVDELVERGEFDGLEGLIYLTDGWGVFPARPPRYRCAFVLCDAGGEPGPVPPWAMRLELAPDELGASQASHPEGGVVT